MIRSLNPRLSFVIYQKGVLNFLLNLNIIRMSHVRQIFASLVRLLQIAAWANSWQSILLSVVGHDS